MSGALQSLTRTLLIARRELGTYTSSPFGWIIVALVLALDGVLFQGWAMRGERSSSEVMSAFFYFSSGVTMTASIFLAMSTFAAERERGTLVLLRTAPTSEWELVWGKYLGVLAFLVLLIALTSYMPLMVMVNGEVATGHVWAGYLGLLLLGATTTAVTVFASAAAPNQVLSAVLGAVLVVFLLAAWYLAEAADPPFQEVLGYLALFAKHYMPFMEGAVHLRSLIFFPSLSFLFLMAAVRVLEARRWR